MLQPAESVDITYSRQHRLPRQYESDEEEVSESEQSAPDHVFSPAESYQALAAFDSDVSADESSDMKRPEYPSLLSPFPPTDKTSRPVSMDTVKRSSCATFAADSYIFDEDEDVVIELPSPNATSPLHSPVLLQPTAYVPPESPAQSRSSSRSSSPSSLFSDEESDVLVAEQVTYVEPETKPNLIVISPSSERSSEEGSPRSSPRKGYSLFPSPDTSNKGVYSSSSAMRSQPLLNAFKSNDSRETNRRVRTASLQLNPSNVPEKRPAPKRAASHSPDSSPALETPSATITSVAEVPEVPPLMPSHHARSMTFSRPKTSGPSNKAMETTTDSSSLKNFPRRPPSLQSLRSHTYPLFHSRQVASPRHEKTRLGSQSSGSGNSEYSMPSHPSSRTPSPSPLYYSSPSFTRDRSGSTFSTSSYSSVRPNRPILPMRNSIMKTSTTPSLYAGSLRSEADSIRSYDMGDTDAQPRHKRMRSLKRSNTPKPDASEHASKKSFMGFMFNKSKRKSTIKSLNA